MNEGRKERSKERIMEGGRSKERWEEGKKQGMKEQSKETGSL